MYFDTVVVLLLQIARVLALLRILVLRRAHCLALALARDWGPSGVAVLFLAAPPANASCIHFRRSAPLPPDSHKKVRVRTRMLMHVKTDVPQLTFFTHRLKCINFIVRAL